MGLQTNPRCFCTGGGFEHHRKWECYLSFTPQPPLSFFYLKAGLAIDELDKQKLMNCALEIYCRRFGIRITVSS